MTAFFLTLIGMLLGSESKHRLRRPDAPAPADQMIRKPNILSVLALIFALATGCVLETTSRPLPSPPRKSPEASGKPLDPSQTARLQRIMVPLVRAGNKTRSLKQVRVAVIEDSNINAANAGGGEFYVTTGLLQKANDDQLRGILAHEIAHDDLGHVARAQVLGTGLNLGVILLEQLLPGSSAVTPIAGTLIARAHSRSEELEADRHAVEILERAGYSKNIMIDALTWVMRSSQNDGGGFLSSHPATTDRIDALRRL
jgi:predicted Zn-dependent protease